MIEIIKRLEIIKNGIAIEDVDLITSQVEKLKKCEIDSATLLIIRFLERCDYFEGLKAINSYTYNIPASVYIDIGLSALRLEFKYVYEKFEKICTQQTEYLTQIDSFRRKYSMALGDYIQNIVYMKIQIAKDKFQKNHNYKKEYEYAREKYGTFKKEFNNTIESSPVNFSKETKQFLKKLYTEYTEISEKIVLKDKITLLKNNIADIESEIKEILESNTYQFIVSLKNWDTYLNEVKTKMQFALSQLQLHVKEVWISDILTWADKNNIPDYQYSEKYKKYIGLPRNKEQLFYITELNLDNKQLTQLPEAIGKLTQLTELSLAHNKLTSLPKSICNLTQLTKLELSNNSINFLPESIYNLTKLNYLSLDDKNIYFTLKQKIWFENIYKNTVHKTLCSQHKPSKYEKENTSTQESLIEYIDGKNDKKEYKSNWIDFNKIIKLHDIKTLYHFTDESNMAYIEQMGGLYSWFYLDQIGVIIPRPGGNELSRHLDRINNLQDYVRLCFNPNQPMKYVAKQDGRIKKCIILEISPEVIYWDSTLFSDLNATATNSIIGDKLENFQKIDFNLLKTGKWSSQEEKKRFQAEVLIKTHIPIKYILCSYPE